MIRDDAYMSTSKTKGRFTGSHELEITVPAGTKALDLDKLSHHKTEGEILFPRGSRLRIDHVETLDNPQGKHMRPEHKYNYRIKATLLPPDAEPRQAGAPEVEQAIAKLEFPQQAEFHGGITVTASGSNGFMVTGPTGESHYSAGADKAAQAVHELRQAHGLTDGPMMRTSEEKAALAKERLNQGEKAREVLTAKKAPVIAAWAAEHNMTPPEYEKAVAAHLKGLVDKGDFATRTTPEKLESILNDNTFKTIHEVGQAKGMGATAHRREAENAFFGHSPVYGYVASPTKDPNSLNDYGNVKIVFKKDAVSPNTTFVRGDSLPAHIAALEGSKAGAVASPVNKPDVYAVAGSKPNQDPLKATLERPSGPTRTELAKFMELQFKQPKVSDIERVDLSEPPSPALKALLDKRGLRYTVNGKARSKR